MPDKPRDDQQEREMPPIPDGGLSTSMPNWLRRPPAWRTLPEREVEQPPAPEAATTLPDVDTSAIDPREFIQDDDLPDWLRTLRRPAPIIEPDQASAFDHPDAQAVSPTQAVEEADQPAILRIDRQPATFRPRRPAVTTTSSSTTTSVSPAFQAFATRPSPLRPWLEQRATTLALGVALVIALLVILILVV